MRISDAQPGLLTGTAFAIFYSLLGVPIGSFLGFLIGGYINDWFGWRMAFVIAGVPGLLVALLLKTTIRELIRGAIEGAARRAADWPPLRKTLQQVLAMRAYLPLAVGLMIFQSSITALTFGPPLIGWLSDILVAYRAGGRIAGRHPRRADVSRGGAAYRSRPDARTASRGGGVI